MVCIERGLHLPLEFLLSCLFELCGICVVLYGRTACRSRYVDTFDLDTWTLQTCIFPPSQAEIRPCFVRVRLKHGRAPSAPVPARVAPAKDRYWSWYFPPLKRFAPTGKQRNSLKGANLDTFILILAAARLLVSGTGAGTLLRVNFGTWRTADSDLALLDPLDSKSKSILEIHLQQHKCSYI